MAAGYLIENLRAALSAPDNALGCLVSGVLHHRGRDTGDTGETRCLTAGPATHVSSKSGFERSNLSLSPTWFFFPPLIFRLAPSLQREFQFSDIIPNQPP